MGIKPEFGKGRVFSGKEISDMAKRMKEDAKDAEKARYDGILATMLRSNYELALEDIQRELREQRKMLEQLLEIKAQNQSISPE